MTEHLYYTSDNTEGQANLLSCSAELDGWYAVVLDRTSFRPQGGGQSTDTGWIDGKRVETVLARGDGVVHIVTESLLSGIVNPRVDAALCQLHARPHSAGHLIGLAGTAFGWLPVKACHRPSEGRITFIADENGTSPDTLSLQEKTSTWQADSLTRRVTFTDGLR